MAAVTKIVIYALECLFAVGIIGSALVVLLTSIEDFEVFFNRNGEPGAGSAPQAPGSQDQEDSSPINPSLNPLQHGRV